MTRPPYTTAQRPRPSHCPSLSEDHHRRRGLLETPGRERAQDHVSKGLPVDKRGSR